ncbi:MAG: hypothetical protein JXR23_09040 [Pontiellaceae bacterium]|nr:hypothetical protein [Pontiellaceae bacterium]
MKKIVVLGLGLVLAIAGCATKPGYVGNWECKKIPADIKEEGMESVALAIQEEGTFALIIKDVEGAGVHGAAGFWTPNEKGGISFAAEGEPVEGFAVLTDDDHLVFSADDQAVEFERKK